MPNREEESESEVEDDVELEEEEDEWETRAIKKNLNNVNNEVNRLPIKTAEGQLVKPKEGKNINIYKYLIFDIYINIIYILTYQKFTFSCDIFIFSTFQIIIQKYFLYI